MSSRFLGADPELFAKWVQDFLPEAKLFSGSNLQVMVLKDHFNFMKEGEKSLEHNIFVSLDGRTFQQVEVRGSGGTEGICRYNCQNVVNGHEFYLYYFTKLVVYVPIEHEEAHPENSVVLNAEVGKLRQNITLLPLPDLRRTEYLLGFPDGGFMFVDVPRYQFSYSSFRFFVGKPREMRQIPIKEVIRYKDGGTTIIYTQEGVFFSPFDRDLDAFWTSDTTALPNEFLDGLVKPEKILKRIDHRHPGTMTLIESLEI